MTCFYIILMVFKYHLYNLNVNKWNLNFTVQQYCVLFFVQNTENSFIYIYIYFLFIRAKYYCQVLSRKNICSCFPSHFLAVRWWCCMIVSVCVCVGEMFCRKWDRAVSALYHRKLEQPVNKQAHGNRRKLSIWETKAEQTTQEVTEI